MWKADSVDINLRLRVISDTGRDSYNPQDITEEPVNSGQIEYCLPVAQGRRPLIPK
jgi:hypothetical protein